MTAQDRLSKYKEMELLPENANARILHEVARNVVHYYHHFCRAPSG